MRVPDNVYAPQLNTLPAVALVLLSFVWTFFKLLPAWIAPSNAPLFSPPPAGILGIDGAGGAPAPGIGGGGGGPPGAPAPGIWGGGGGAEGLPDGSGGGGGAFDGLAFGIGGAGGGPDDAVGDAGVIATAGLSRPVGLFLSSMAESGRGGPMVPKRMLASCFAEPPVGPSSSSDEELASSSTTDQSSSSPPRVRVRAVGADAGPFCPSRWKGLVDSAAAGVGTDGAAGSALAFAFAAAIFFKKGFLFSASTVGGAAGLVMELLLGVGIDAGGLGSGNV